MLACLCLGLVLIPETWADLAAYKRDVIMSGEWWRLWSGHFVHFTPMHAFVNSALLLLLSVVIGRVYSWKLVGALFLIGPPVISLALLYLVPEMDTYRGTSALAALFMTISIALALDRTHGITAFLLYALIVVWLAKLFSEIAGGIGFSNLPPGVHVAWQAHIAGILVGMALNFGLRQLELRAKSLSALDRILPSMSRISIIGFRFDKNIRNSCGSQDH